MSEVTVVGGGLAGSEAAWQLAERGHNVRLFEMRPGLNTGAHTTQHLAELVCSNSLGSQLPDRAPGVLLAELEHMGSMLIQCARATEVPAGGALAVDRTAFAAKVTERLERHPQIDIVREEMRSIPDGITIIATGPLTSPKMSDELTRLSGEQHLYFFDAISPIVEADSIDRSIAFRGSRYGRGIREEGDYINCPMDERQYTEFVRALVAADRIPLRSFESAISSGVRAGLHRYFESCLPLEILAERGEKSLAFGPLRPVGLVDPRTNKRSHAVVQLRQDDLAGELYNLVGFQTNLRYGEQRRVLRMIPGLENAQFARYGQMHRNTFMNSPKLLEPTLQFRGRDDLFFAGQLTGVEGYLGNIATGLLAGVNAARVADGDELMTLPEETMLGALCHYITHADSKNFQPMKANFGILPPLPPGKRMNRRDRARARAERAKASLAEVWPPQGETLRIAIA
ncbi:MAG: methylenetetrahydrofolate--tRNA-(uracil(54)-C(5))-methyltransferase (FADH(2)-oxidizing) TrmFO [Chloroflexi bacterium]|nr:methylenetetrahydrofolate--tRNA-(uracil(54)-C(5))-methyltransferase (FADH(2)-oxidizing) TrmFO [Chloroflexota bacterium]MDK1044350.1 methylenetetrahydrofolate--tRNA-(uracil(54)-C(5))-methyltransferase (FADH(2)-oxidizing) TrmFO [Anaerolineales bacterium]MCI0772113.1 methylenetetrahydrofolate--tRNA-(uracil(54)-C(5))-methyltransferase (FADH(2)-oxidizing) TrmFO [Chloroflexota bacterium]MCI0805465.1 methylenetetrahydrofolate--tRNA-(uracil(54)-C(5))-methyltransferase (FADH(2)-oxidizing) TrmFO [Chlor